MQIEDLIRELQVLQKQGVSRVYGGTSILLTAPLVSVDTDTERDAVLIFERPYK